MNPRIPLLLVVLSSAPLAQADVYKCVDEAGHVTYTNSKTSARGCTTLSRDQAVSSISGGGRPVAVPPHQSGASSGGAGFPCVDSGTQKARDGDRRRILEDELSAEQKGLDIARRELEEQQLARYGNASGGGDRLQSSREKVQLHERNIEALRREIGNLR